MNLQEFKKIKDIVNGMPCEITRFPGDSLISIEKLLLKLGELLNPKDRIKYLNEILEEKTK